MKLRYFGLIMVLMLSLTACHYYYSPPYNNFQPPIVPLRQPKIPSVIPIEIAAAPTVPCDPDDPRVKDVIAILGQQSVQVVVYNRTMTVIVPTDKFFVFDTAELNDLQFLALANIIQLLRMTRHNRIYVAGFNDDVGTDQHKLELSQARAQTMASFLWAYGISAFCLDAKGYGDKFDVADNHLIHGSAMNRRVEIQWEF